MGSSGSGKSTLLYCLSSMDTPTSGKVHLLGKDISILKEKDIAMIRKKDIAFVFQAIHLLQDLTVFENIAYAGYGTKAKHMVNQSTDELLEKFGLVSKANKYPSELSGGEQQRVAIARALINDIKVLFADEPTGALNSSAGEIVLDTLTTLNEEGESIVMVTHDLKACARANRVLYLQDGRIVGELILNRYHPKEKKERENLIFKFLKEHNW